MTDDPKKKEERVNFDGLRAAAEMLNELDEEHRERLLASVARENPEVARRIQEKMFVFADIENIPDVDFQLLLKEIPRDLLLLALRNAPDGVSRHVFDNLSMRMSEELREEMAGQAPRRLSEVRQAQEKIVEIAKKLIAEGRIRPADDSEGGTVE